MYTFVLSKPWPYEEVYMLDKVTFGKLMKTKLSRLEVEIPLTVVPLGALLNYGIEEGFDAIALHLAMFFKKSAMATIKKQYAKKLQKIKKFHRNDKLLGAMTKDEYNGRGNLFYIKTNSYDSNRGARLIAEQRRIVQEVLGDDKEQSCIKRDILDDLDWKERRLDYAQATLLS